MALTNEQFDNIMYEYEKTRNANNKIMEARRKEISEKIPRIDEINAEIANLSLEASVKAINGDGDAILSLKENTEVLLNEKYLLLERNGFDRRYLEPVYTCRDCRDTGYIGNEKCHCLKQKIIDFLYSQSNLKEILHKENFDNFNFDYYSPDIYNEKTGKNALDNIQEIVDYCYTYIKHFDAKPKSILIQGNTGVGKTYLTNCIAKELIEKGKLVVYISAIKFFDLMADYSFNSKKIEGANDTVNMMFDCDLLIIDDLGTEFTNSFSGTALFNCINERMINSKSTIISTNLSLNDIKKKYSERIYSRILGNYQVFEVFGKDIRLESIM